MDQVKSFFGLENQETKATVDEAHFAYRNREFRFLDFTVDRMEWVIHNECDKFIIFCVDVSEYDVFDQESNENALHKSISLFEWTCQMTYDINIILFLNKKDLFAKKIKATPLSVCFPDYKGENALEEATAYIEGQFLSHGRSANPKDTNYYFKNLIYWTDATDANGMRVVVDSLVDTIIRKEQELWYFC